MNIHDIPNTAPPPTDSRLAKARYAKRRRDYLRKIGRCICGPIEGNIGRDGVEHGPVVQGGRCQRCWDLKRGESVPSSVPCTQCGASIGRPCRAQFGAGPVTRFHQVRRDAAKAKRRSE